MQNKTPETRGFAFMRLFFAADELFAHHVRLQLFRNANRAVGLLMIFQERHQRPRGGNAGIVQRMHEFDSAVGVVAITQVVRRACQSVMLEQLWVSR